MWGNMFCEKRQSMVMNVFVLYPSLPSEVSLRGMIGKISFLRVSARVPIEGSFDEKSIKWNDRERVGVGGMCR